MPIDLNRTEEIFATSTDLTVGLEEEFALLDPQTLDLVPRFEELRDAAALDPGLQDAIAGELISSEIEIVSGRGEDFHEAVANQRDRRRRLFALAAERGVPLGSTGTHPWADYREQREHRHRALPPRRRRARLRRAPQQHLLAARPRRRAGRRPRRRRLRSPAPDPAAAARRQRELAVSRGPRHAAALGPHADLHEVLSALRRARRVRQLAGLSRLHRAADRHELDRRVHAGVVVDPAARVVRHGRGPDRRRADHRRGVRGAGRADRRDGRAGAARHRRRRAGAGSPAPADRGEPLARRPARDGRQHDRPAARHGDQHARGARGSVRLDEPGARGARDRDGARRAATAPSASARRCRRGASLRDVYAETVRETTTTYAQEVPA